MKRLISAAVISAAVVTIIATGATVAGAAKRGAAPYDGPATGQSDLPGPLGLKQRELRKQAVQLKLQGKIAKDAKVAKLGTGKKGKAQRTSEATNTQFVELARTGEDTIWTVLAEFGDQVATHNHGALGVINHGGTPGPLHNAIPEP